MLTSARARAHLPDRSYAWPQSFSAERRPSSADEKREDGLSEGWMVEGNGLLSWPEGEEGEDKRSGERG